MPTAKSRIPVHLRISASMLHNSGIFLRKAAEEIAGHDDKSDDPFDEDRATLVTVLIQTAVELASAAIIIRHDGLAGVMRKSVPQSEQETEKRWKDGDIRTRPFEDVKSRASELFGEPYFWSLVDTFQPMRNKLIHFHHPQHKADLFDLKYEATHVLIQMVATLEEAEYYDLPEGSRSFFGKTLFDKLISFEPYRFGIERRAEQIGEHTIQCIICDIKAFMPDAGKCLACGFSGEMFLLECPSCSKRAVFYDHLNLPINSELLGKCGACGKYCRTARCSVCRDDYAVNSTEPLICPQSDYHD